MDKTRIVPVPASIKNAMDALVAKHPGRTFCIDLALWHHHSESEPLVQAQYSVWVANGDDGFHVKVDRPENTLAIVTEALRLQLPVKVMATTDEMVEVPATSPGG